MAGQQADDPVLGEEDVAGPLDFREDVQGRSDVGERLRLPERMVQEAEAILRPGLCMPVFGLQQCLEDGIAHGLVRMDGGEDEVV